VRRAESEEAGPDEEGDAEADAEVGDVAGVSCDAAGAP